MSVQGPCPNCGTETQTYFGDIFTVKGSRDTNLVQCSNCSAKITFNAAKRAVCAFHIYGYGGIDCLSEGPKSSFWCFVAKRTVLRR